MVGIVVPGPMRDHYVCPLFPEQPGDLSAILKRRQPFAIMNITHLGLDAKPLGHSR